MLIRECETEPIAPAAAGRMLGGSLLLAAGMLLSSWLRVSELVPGVDVLVIVVAGLLFAWLVNGIARVRGLPLAVAAIGTVVAFVGWALGTFGGGFPGGVTVFMALLLSVYSRSWTVGLVATAILVGSEILTWFI